MILRYDSSGYSFRNFALNATKERNLGINIDYILRSDERTRIDAMLDWNMSHIEPNGSSGPMLDNGWEIMIIDSKPPEFCRKKYLTHILLQRKDPNGHHHLLKYVEIGTSNGERSFYARYYVNGRIKEDALLTQRIERTELSALPAQWVNDLNDIFKNMEKKKK